MWSQLPKDTQLKMLEDLGKRMGVKFVITEVKKDDEGTTTDR